MNLIYWKGKLWPSEKRVLSPLNSGVLFGESLFETIPVYGGNPLFWEDHLERLKKGCRFLNWTFPSEKEFEKGVRLFSKTVEPSIHFLVRFSLVQELKGQAGPREFPSHPPTLFGTIRPLRHDFKKFWPLQGEVGISHWRTPHANMVPNAFKNASYLTIRAAFREHPEWDEILRLNDEDQVVDGGGSTPLWFDGKRIFSPPLKLGGLESVTRKRILELCGKIGLMVIEKSWKPSNVFKKGELFFAGSGVGVMRVARLQNRKLKTSSFLAVRLWQHYRKWAFEKANSIEGF